MQVNFDKYSDKELVNCANLIKNYPNGDVHLASLREAILKELGKRTAVHYLGEQYNYKPCLIPSSNSD